MTKTVMSLEALREKVPHLSAREEKTHVLSWGGDGQPVFEVGCQSADAEGLKHLDERLSRAFEAARKQLG